MLASRVVVHLLVLLALAILHGIVALVVRLRLLVVGAAVVVLVLVLLAMVHVWPAVVVVSTAAIMGSVVVVIRVAAVVVAAAPVLVVVIVVVVAVTGCLVPLLVVVVVGGRVAVVGAVVPRAALLVATAGVELLLVVLLLLLVALVVRVLGRSLLWLAVGGGVHGLRLVLGHLGLRLGLLVVAHVHGSLALNRGVLGILLRRHRERKLGTRHQGGKSSNRRLEQTENWRHCRSPKLPADVQVWWKRRLFRLPLVPQYLVQGVPDVTVGHVVQFLVPAKAIHRVVDLVAPHSTCQKSSQLGL